MLLLFVQFNLVLIDVHLYDAVDDVLQARRLTMHEIEQFELTTKVGINPHLHLLRLLRFRDGCRLP